MIVKSEAGTLYIFKEDKRFWVMLKEPSRHYNDYLRPYVHYKYFIAPLTLTKWSEE